MMKTPGLSSIPWFRSTSERKNARLSGHHRLNFIRFQRDVPHQIDEAIFRDEDVIFEADPQVFFPDVDARLYGKHMARFNGFVPVADVVHIESNEMRGPVHEVLFVSRPSRILVGHFFRCDQSEID